jgi:hypothetical protein
MKEHEILPTNISAQDQNASGRRVTKEGAVFASILAAGLVAMAAGLVAVAGADSNSRRSDQAATNGTEAAVAAERSIERSGTLLAHGILY